MVNQKSEEELGFTPDEGKSRSVHCATERAKTVRRAKRGRYSREDIEEIV